MAEPKLVQASFDRMIRDMPRDRLPKGSCWNIVDMIPNELGAPLAKRGGWTYGSQLLTNVHAGADYAQGIISAPYNAGEQLVAATRDAGTSTRCIQVVSALSTTDRGAMFNDDLGQPPVFYRNNTYFVPAAGVLVAYAYNGSANATLLPGSPPTGSRCTVYKDRLVLARSDAQRQRLWFSGAGSPNVWDVTFGYIDTSHEAQAIYALRNSILVFHNTSLERIVGSTPPPGGDMSVQPLFDTGTTYPFSLAGTDEFVCFANQSGIYMTDGSAVIDLTEQGGMRNFWRQLFTAPRHVAGGFSRDHYVCSVWNSATGAFVDGFLVQIRTRRFTRISNMAAYCYSPAPSSTDEMYWASRALPRINTFTPIFNPTASTKTDADGTAVLPVMELPYVTVGQSKARIGEVYLRYLLTDASADEPRLVMSYILDPTDTAYTNVVGRDGNIYYLAKTTRGTRVRRQIDKADFGIGVRLTQQNPSLNTFFNTFEIGSHAREGSGVP